MFWVFKKNAAVFAPDIIKWWKVWLIFGELILLIGIIKYFPGFVIDVTSYDPFITSEGKALQTR